MGDVFGPGVHDLGVDVLVGVQVKLCTDCKGAKSTKQTVSTAQKAKNIEALAKEILGTEKPKGEKA
jgi:hypothetical protein